MSPQVKQHINAIQRKYPGFTERYARLLVDDLAADVRLLGL